MFVHGANLEQKELSQSKYSDKRSKSLLGKIRSKYNLWREKNLELKGPFYSKSEDDQKILTKRVRLFNEYKDFIDKQEIAEHFDSRSNLHSSVLEEFLYYLFKDLVESISSSTLIGKSHTFKDMFFQAQSFKDMTESPSAKIEIKNHDFVIGVSIEATMRSMGSSKKGEVHTIHVPAIAIECKTYLDKTMLEGASTAAEQLKTRNPHSIYFVVAEWLKLTEKVNLRKYKVDQIYVLRKQKNTDREFRYLPGYVKNPVYIDVVQHLFDTAREHLTSDWEGQISKGLERGFLVD